MASLPEPLTPPDLDLRDFDWMPLQVVRLRDSGIVVVASAEAFRAAVLLWCASWHQVPAASLPNDEKMLCSLAGFGRDVKTWRAMSADALRGFVECSDGRLYHPVIAEKAVESGSKKRKQGSRTEAATEAARLARLRRDAEREAERNGDRDGVRNVAEDIDRDGNQERGPERIGEDHIEIKKEREPLSVSDSRSEKDRPKPIDDSYQPSDTAIEYAYSLGMKKADLNSELSKFCADGMAKRAVSFDLDASFKKRCDQWLDYQRRNPPKGAAVIAVSPPELTAGNWTSYVKNWLMDESRWPRGIGGPPGSPTCRCPEAVLVRMHIDPESGWLMSRLVKIISTTEEMTALVTYRQANNLTPPKLYQITVDGCEQTVRWEKSQWPPGYNDFGERIEPSDSEENAA